jgi:RNA polymerase-binding transcription factor DksA
MQSKANTPKARGQASILDILGGPDLNGRPPRKWAEHHAELVRLRDYLTGKRQSHTDNGRAEPSTSGEHMADAASDSYDRDRELAMASSDQSMLYEVNDALSRITNGSYGLCEITGEPIEPSRLKALPWTRFSAEAQAELEARGATSRARLGTLGTYGSLPSESEPADEGAEEPAAERKAA